MPSSDDFGLIFNCGFSRTFVLECSTHQSDYGKKRTAEKKKESENMVRSDHDLSVLFQSWFNGPRFTVGCNYFVNTVNSVHPFSIVIVNDYTRRGGSRSDHGKRDMLKRIMFRLFPQ